MEYTVLIVLLPMLTFFVLGLLGKKKAEEPAEAPKGEAAPAEAKPEESQA